MYDTKIIFLFKDFLVLFYYIDIGDFMELIKPKEAAQILAVSVATLRQWVKNKKISEIRTLGNHRRFKLDEINIILDGYEKHKQEK